MEKSGFSLLQQFSRFRNQLEQVDKEIEAEIRETRKIESDIVQCADMVEKEKLKEHICKMAFVSKDTYLLDLSAQCEVVKESASLSEAIWLLLDKRRQDIQSKLDERRDAFVCCCKLFQQDQNPFSGASETNPIRATHVQLMQTILSMKQEIQTARYTKESLLHERSQKLHQLISENEELHISTNHESVRLELMLTDVDSLKTALFEVWASDERLQRELLLIEEEKKKLVDCIADRQQYLISKQDEERKLRHLCNKRSSSFCTLGQKIQEIAELSQAYQFDEIDILHGRCDVRHE